MLTILTKKIIRSHTDPLYAIEHIKQLHKYARHHPSFIKGTTYWNSNTTKIYTLSHWKNSKGWESWLISNERHKSWNDNLASDIYESESHEYLFEIIKTNHSS